MTENELGAQIVDAAIMVHRALGPGLLESVYESVMCIELRRRGLHVVRQHPVPIDYDGHVFERGFRVDLVVEGKVVVEIKALERLSPTHLKQVHTYLRFTGCRLGFLLNFGGALMKDGILRCVNPLALEKAEERQRKGKGEAKGVER